MQKSTNLIILQGWAKGLSGRMCVKCTAQYLAVGALYICAIVITAYEPELRATLAPHLTIICIGKYLPDLPSSLSNWHSTKSLPAHP